MRLNRKGFVVEGALVIGLLSTFALLFVQNPVSSALGIGIRPNKTVQIQSSEQKVEFLKRDLVGRPVAEPDGSYLTRTTVAQRSLDTDKNQGVSLWEQIRAIPGLLILLVLFGIGSPVVGGRLWALYQGVKKELMSYHTDTKKIVRGIDLAFLEIPRVLAGANLPGEIDRVYLAEKIESAMKSKLGDIYNDSTKELVKKIRAV